MEQPRVDGADPKAILDLLSAAKIDCYDDCLLDPSVRSSRDYASE